MNTFSSHARKSFTSGDRTKEKALAATEQKRKIRRKGRMDEVLPVFKIFIKKGVVIRMRIIYNDSEIKIKGDTP